MEYGFNNQHCANGKPFCGNAIALNGYKKNDCFHYRIGRFTFYPRKRLLSIDDKQTRLTIKESELLALLCSHANEILMRELALKTVWFYSSHFTARSMDVYIMKLRKILKADERIKIINIHGKGHKLVMPCE